MDQENVVFMHNTVLFSHKEGNYVVCVQMQGTGDHHGK
jgi:hypothetical protein